MTLIVLGSANIDYTVVVERHPASGETVMGGDVVIGTGGKGANQALAAARSGARPAYVGAVGDDAGGGALREALSGGGVDVAHLETVASSPTGVALITVSRDGENAIVVAPGANARLEPASVRERVAAAIVDGAGSDGDTNADDASSAEPARAERLVLLAQLEVPLAAVEAAAAALEPAGGRLVLNLSPSRPVPDALLALCDPLVVNESEASDLAGQPVDGPAAAAAAAVALLERCRSVVITLGGKGAIFASRDASSGHRPAPHVPVVDTTGAGDAFVGALAAALASGAELDAAVELGVAAGAEAVQWAGAQPPRA